MWGVFGVAFTVAAAIVAARLSKRVRRTADAKPYANEELEPGTEWLQYAYIDQPLWDDQHRPPQRTEHVRSLRGLFGEAKPAPAATRIVQRPGARVRFLLPDEP